MTICIKLHLPTVELSNWIGSQVQLKSQRIVEGGPTQTVQIRQAATIFIYEHDFCYITIPKGEEASMCVCGIWNSWDPKLYLLPFIFHIRIQIFSLLDMKMAKVDQINGEISIFQR